MYDQELYRMIKLLGKIDINNDIEDKSQTIPRADVATVLVECLNEEATIGKTFEMLAGETRNRTSY